ncbi:MAG TPA: phosphate ABC transporter substrate-binding protein PstS [bacterium]|nr:phosphate ABC transporter substrate-binding protein PstS [bacterium]
MIRNVCSRRTAALMALIAAILPIAFGTSGLSVAWAAPVKLLETGSTLLYPLFNIWVPDYTHTNPDVQITTQGTGSGTGIAEATSGAAQIGASDAYLSPAQTAQDPTLMNIPLAISAQQINYNLPGIGAAHLNFSGPVLAGIYSGTIKNWNDPAIAKLNPGVNLPDHEIIPVHRADGSGDTFIFTQYLSFTTPSWKEAVGFGTSVSWPAIAVGIGTNGNPGMVQALKQTPYSIAYVGISWIDQTNAAGFGYAALENRAGKFLLPTPGTIASAAAALVGKTPPNEAISLIFAPGPNAYPIINYEYVIVKGKQADPGVAAAIKAFLTWCLSPTGGGNELYLTKVHFIGLSEMVRKLSQAQVERIGQ